VALSLSAVRLLGAALLGALAAVPAGAAPAAPTPPALLARHLPVLVLHPAERFRPVRAEGFLADADLQRRTATGWESAPGALPAGGAGLRLDQRLCRAVDGAAATPCYAQAQSADGSAPVVYGATFRTKSRIVLQYWLWYPWNGYSPTVPPGEVWQVHEGDWESVSVLLDRDGRPLHVGVSRHCAGARREWRKAPRRGRRPLVHVALGSHANYFGPGTFPHDPRCWPEELRDVVRSLGLVDHTGSGRIVRPRLVRVDARRPAWMRFAGTWGEDGYVHFPNNAPIAYAGSPRGPAFHEQWRRPVAEVLSWPPG
jgi:hypothetical protein